MNPAETQPAASQPAPSQPTPSQPAATEIAPLIASHAGREGPLLPILHDLQGQFGMIPAAAPAMIAGALNLSLAEVTGVISFYHDFRDAPQGRHVLKICRAEACQAMGGADMARRLLALLGLDWNQTAADGSLTVEPVYCLGLCACGPAAMLDGRLLGRVTAEGLAARLPEGTA